MDISHPHDSFFKFLLSKVDRAIDFIRHQIPSHIAKHLRIDTMKPESDTFVDSQLQNRFSDAVFKVQTFSGTLAYLYFLIDHKSTPDTGVGIQLHRYINQIWELHLTNHPNSALPPVIGIVIYHGMHPWNIETDLTNQLD